QNAADLAQSQFGDNMTNQVRDLQSTDKDQAVNNIVSAAAQQLSYIDSALINASLPDKLDMEATKNAIRADALAKLQALDSQLSQGVSSIKPISNDEAAAQGQALATAGTAPE